MQLSYQSISSPDLPLGEWDTDTVCGWLLEMGLENYVAEARRWVKNGKHLSTASNNDLDKELGMKVRFSTEETFINTLKKIQT